MSRFLTLVGIALRELWISFRLLAVLGALVLATLPVVLLPRVMSPDLAGAPLDPFSWAAVGLALAETLVAGIAAATLSGERRRGTAGWLTARAVPRPSVALSWFVALALLVAGGLLPAAALVWLSLEPFLAGGLAALLAATSAIACAGLAALAVGILIGALLPRLPGAAVSAAVSAALLVPPALGASGWWWLPADGLRVFAALDTAARPVADALRAAGAALGLAAVLLVAAVMVFERADL